MAGILTMRVDESTILARVGPDLGKHPDHVLADEARVSAPTIGRIRRSLGIAPVPKGDKPWKLGPYLHLIGTMTDQDVAQLARCSRVAVTRMRKRHGVPAFARRAS
jgi:hypothetical protein